MNAPQLGTAVNNPATAVGSSSLGDFLLANSTNFAGATDFKTIAAPFFTSSTKPAASTGQAPTPPFTATTKSSGTVIREREPDKDNRPQNVEPTLSFLPPIIPAHLLNIVPPPPQATSNMASAELPAQSDAQANSPGPKISLPTTTSLQFLTEVQPLANTQKFADATTNEKTTVLHGISSLRANTGTQPQHIKGDETFRVPEKPTQSLQDDAPAVLQLQILESTEQLPVIGQPNITRSGQALQTPGFSATKTNPALPITTDFAPRPIVLKIDVPSARPTINHPPQKFAANPIYKDLTQPKAATLATNVARPSTPSTDLRPDPDTRPAQAVKPSASKQEYQPETLTSKQPNSKVESNPISQPSVTIPQSVSDTVKSIFTTAGVSINEPAAQTIVSRPEMSSTPDSLPPTTIAQTKSGEPVVSTTASDLKDDKVQPNVLASSPVVIPTAKSTVNKTRTETTSKTKNLRTNAETTVDASNNPKEHRHEVNAVSGPQAATNADTNKDHEVATSVANFAPHSKSASAKSEPGTSDSASAAQLPDTDDTAPVAHTSINTAKLVQGLSQSELRVGFQTRDFGNIDIRTSVNHHEFSAQISVEHNDVARTLTTELPGLYARLNEQQVPVSSIHIQNQSLSTSSGLDQHSQQSSSHQQSGFVRSQLEPTLPAIQEALNPTDRLDIRI